MSRAVSVPWRLALAAPLLLLAATTALLAVSHTLTEARRFAELQSRAESAGTALSDRLARALGAGVPLDRLQGVEALFSQRLRDLPDLRSIGLRQGERLLVHSGPAAGAGEATVVVPVAGAAGLVVELRWQAGRQLPSADSVLRTLAALLAMALIAAGLAQHAWDSGPRLRHQMLDAQADLINTGRLDVAVLGARRSAYEARPQQLLGRLRNVVELQARLQRLLDSLRSTEPERLRRERIDRLSQQARGDETFPAAEPERRPIDSREADQVLGATALACAGGLSLVSATTLAADGRVVAAYAAFLLAAVVAVAALTRGRWPAAVRGGLAGGLLAPALVALSSGVAVLASAAALALVAAVSLRATTPAELQR